MDQARHQRLFVKAALHCAVYYNYLKYQWDFECFFQLYMNFLLSHLSRAILNGLRLVFAISSTPPLSVCVFDVITLHSPHLSSHWSGSTGGSGAQESSTEEEAHG
ncbi:hypothetical protein Q8A73_019329 [Channa argus]|nr:hypothetical protein Q8A73_019329 [Channa argus]